MISYDSALDIVYAAHRPAQPQTLDLIKAAGRIAACDVFSPLSVPSFRNAAMDGYALKAAITQGACAINPIKLRVEKSIFAGETPAHFEEQRAVKIMTGAAVPEPYDTILPVEQAILTPDSALIITEPLKGGTHIRQVGEDFTCGEVLLSSGELITPELIMLLAAAGIAQIAVLERPSVIIFSTGDEICETGAALSGPASLYNASAPYLRAKVAAFGLDCQYGGIIRDDPDALAAHLSRISPHTLVITTGAVSAGEKDFVPEVLRDLGAEILFHKVAIKPGKPILMARLPNQAIVFALPGNPVSTAVGWQMFILPYLRHVCALPPDLPVMVRLSQPYEKTGDLTLFLRAHLSLGQDMEMTAHLDTGQQSFKTKTFAQSDGFIRIDAGALTLRANDPVACYLFGH